MRYFLTLSYKGTAYNGWQAQQNAPSIQGELERALSTILRTPCAIIGAGRTDTGVHALYYIAHFDTAECIADTESFCYHLNAILPKDIAIKSALKVNNDAHARFDAIEREYTYFIRTAKDPFTLDTAWQLYVPLNIDAMNTAAEYLMQYDDFTTFAKLNSSNKTNICHISYAHWKETANGIVFTIRANRFLRNMVRAITGTLVEVGKGRMTPERFGEIISARDLSLSASSAPAQGLFLSDIKYHIDIYARDM